MTVRQAQPTLGEVLENIGGALIRFLPILGWLAKYNWTWLAEDLIASPSAWTLKGELTWSRDPG
jgi:hypothetical protein